MSAPLALRVTVLDTWDEVVLELPPDTTLAQVKRAALARMGIRRPPAEYVLKHDGAALLDEERTAAECGLGPNAALIVLPRRRMPVR
jgi:hypothetical protein